MPSRIIAAAPLLTLLWGGSLFGQTAAVERFVSEDLKPYYSHTGFSWKIAAAPHFEMNYEADSEAERRLDQLKGVAERSRSSILKLLGEPRYDPTIHIFFVESIERMHQLIGAEVIGRSRPNQHAVFCVVAPFSELSLNHELSHEIATNLWGPAEHWLEEGLANFVVDNKSALMKRECLAMLQSKQWIPLNKLISPDWESSSFSPDDTYPELGGFVEYLYETYGLEKFQQLWKNGARSLKKIYGKRFSKLDSDFRNSILKHRPEIHDAISITGQGGDLLLKEEIPNQHRINP